MWDKQKEPKKPIKIFYTVLKLQTAPKLASDLIQIIWKEPGVFLTQPTRRLSLWIKGFDPRRFYNHSFYVSM